MGGQAKEINGTLARRENFEFNHIHEYDVIIFAHEHGSSKFNRFQGAFFDHISTKRKDGEDF